MTVIRSFRFATFLVIAALAAAPLEAGAEPAAGNAPPALDRVSRTSGEVEVAGRRIGYDALVEETILDGTGDATEARLVTTSYLRSGVTGAADRPVLFLFNGGPGASTTPLHFGAFGPKRRVSSGDAEYVVDNPHTPLDAVDLVFIDPVGTGYSRPSGDGAPYWSRSGDARSVAAVIEAWLVRHDREDSPRYLLGQSYGTVRAAEIVRLFPDLSFDGVLLFALVTETPDGLISHALDLPAMAATAWRHGRSGVAADTVEDIYAGAVAYARTDYVSALMQGGALPQPDKEAVAAHLARLTGLDRELILESDLRVGRRDFMFNLLADEGLRTGRLDTRATARLDAPAQRPPYDDPGLSYVPEGAAPQIDCPGPGCLAAVGEGSVVDAYYREMLGFENEEPYRALNLDVNQAWDFEGGMGSPAETLAAAMAARPELRLFWAAGYYDLGTPAYAGRFALDQAHVPAERLTAAYFPAGHSVFVGEENHAALSAAVRAFVTAD